MTHQVKDGDVHTLRIQGGCSFQSKQTSADNHGVTIGLQHLLDVIKIAKADNTRQIVTFNRNEKGGGACCNHQFVVVRRAICSNDPLILAIDLYDCLPKPARNTVVVVPVDIMCNDFVVGHFTSKNWRQHDAVIVSAWLGTEKSDVVGIWRKCKQFLQHPARGHSCTDND